MVLTHYRIVTVVLYAPLRLSPTRTLQRVGDSLGEATVFGWPASKLAETPIPTVVSNLVFNNQGMIERVVQ